MSNSKSKSTSKSSSGCSNDPYAAIRTYCNMPPPPPPMVYRPDRCCYEKVKGPFKNPIPTKQQRYYDKFREQCCPPSPPQAPCCDDIRKQNACKAELLRLRYELWKEQDRKAMSKANHHQECMERQYKEQIQDWRRAQAKCEIDRQRRKAILKQLLLHRVEMKKLKREARIYEQSQQMQMMEQQEEQEALLVKALSQQEDELRWEQEKLRIQQENRMLDSQMQPRNSQCMKVPELEELRRMFVPVEKGPKETLECFMLEPFPSEEERRQLAEQQMQSLMGLRNTHGIHLNLSDRAQKKTTIQVAMGPKFSSAERQQYCKVFTTPGALCSSCDDDGDGAPSVQIPQCLKPLMQTLSYRVNEIDTPLLSMKTFGGGNGNDGGSSNGKEVALESGPNFNGARLFGTIVLPKGKALSPFYTQPYNVTF